MLGTMMWPKGLNNGRTWEQTDELLSEAPGVPGNSEASAHFCMLLNCLPKVPTMIRKLNISC